MTQPGSSMHVSNASTHTPLLAEGGGGSVVQVRTADVGQARESLRRRRLRTVLIFVAVAIAYLDWKLYSQHPLLPVPHVDPMLVAAFLPMVLLSVGAVVYYAASGRSPHEVFRPEQIDVRLADVVGIDPVKEEVIRSLNLFLAAPHLRQHRWAAGPAAACCSRAVPAPGKTFLAKAMAAEAGVPFLFATATSFQSSFYGATARRIRSFFKDLRRIARAEGGAIAFIDEFDAIGGRRSGMEMTPAPALHAVPGTSLHGCGGLVGPAPLTSARGHAGRALRHQRPRRPGRQ